MAYVPLTTQSPGGAILASYANQIKDNFAAGVPDIFTTKGDLAIGNGNDAAARLGVGTNYQVLEALSSSARGVQYGDGVRSLVAKAGAQSIATATMTKITVSTVISDAFSMLDSLNNRITIPSGFPTRQYVIFADGWFTGHATVNKYRHIEIQLNGSAYARQSLQQDDGTEATGLSVLAMVQLAAANYIEVFVKQNSGGNLNFNDTHLGLFMIR